MQNQVNLNDIVKVKLTELGKETYRRYWASYNFIDEPVMDEDGYFKIQLHMLMRIFGSRMGLGVPEVFQTTEIIIERTDK